MAGSYTGNYSTALTLSTATTIVTISGTVGASASVGLTMGGSITLAAAVYGPKGAHFTLNNTGILLDTGTGADNFGLVLASGGQITNHASIVGTGGVAVFGTAASVLNNGQISGTSGEGVYLQNAGYVANQGGISGAGGGYGIEINNATGAFVTNSSSASIYGGKGNTGAGIGLLNGAGTILNSGVINSNYRGIGVTGSNTSGALISNETGGSIGSLIWGVYTQGGVTIDNAGTIAGGLDAVHGSGAGLVLDNTGTIEGTIASSGATRGNAVYVTGSAAVTNGSATGKAALIYGEVDISGIGTVTNFATIANTGNLAAKIGGGTIINGSATDTTALVNGGVLGGASGGMAQNFGTILSSSTVNQVSGSLTVNQAFDAVNLGAGFTFINGSTSDTTAVVHDLTGVQNISLGQNDTIINYGSLLGGSVGGIYIASGTLSNASTGVILGGKYGVHAAGYGSVAASNAGLIEGTIGFSAVLRYKYNIDLTNSGTIASSNGTTGTAVDLGNGTNILKIDPSATFIGKVIGGTGSSTLEFASAATAGTFGSQFTAFRTIAFDTGATWTLEGTASAFGGETITGFAVGDTIDLQGLAVTSDSFVSGTGLVVGNGTVTETLGITGSFSTGSFTLTSDANGGTNVYIACFAAGTRIATSRGRVAVEALRIGDRVKTMHGGLSAIKWIGTRGYEGRFIAGNRQALPIRIRRHAIARNVPSRDLYVSPDHAICEGGMLIPAWRLVNGVSITQAAQVEQITYFHVELEKHDVIFAENCPAESFLNADCRGRFLNAMQFAALYPGAEVPQSACLPRLEDGFYLQLIQQRLAARAGIMATPGVTGPLRGFADELGPRMVRGWAQDTVAPEAPVCLEILAGSQVVGLVLANCYREDLRLAGLGSGCHGFAFVPPPGVTGALTVRRASDGAMLPLAAQAGDVRAA